MPVLAGLWIIYGLLAGPFTIGYAEDYSVWKSIDANVDIDSLFNSDTTALIDQQPIPSTTTPNLHINSDRSIFGESKQANGSLLCGKHEEPSKGYSLSESSQTQMQSGPFASLDDIDSSVQSLSEEELSPEIPDIWTLIPMTSLVLIAALGTAVLLKWFQSSRPIQTPQRIVRQIETLNLGPRARLHLVAVHDENILVAIDTHGIKSVTVVPSWSRGIDSEAIVTTGEKTSDQGSCDVC
ncbi:flagellar biosynthetic protein FliO [Thalassoglobus sp. JC818]|uniref:flagellar biosynthetic protein FliO n=1 Tax=Thalassoglobus sp. JC818 TaxID=3232136 RepID=UPI003458B693